jgi:hypothetical protein
MSGPTKPRSSDPYEYLSAACACIAPYYVVGMPRTKDAARTAFSRWAILLRTPSGSYESVGEHKEFRDAWAEASRLSDKWRKERTP